MATNTDAQFTARFSPQTISGFVANQTDLAGFKPTASPLNVGLMSDIGRATIYGPDTQPSFYGRFMRAPLGRGDAVLKGMVEEIKSGVYDPKAPDTALFDAPQPGFMTNVAKKNFSRQIKVEINDYMLNQFAQTDEMIGEAEAAIMATSNVAYMDDMWVAAKAYFSGTTNGAKKEQMVTLTNKVGAAGFGDELIESLWDFTQKDFAYKSTKYNAAGRNTRSDSVSVVLKKDVEYPAFKKLLSETFNPEYLNLAINGGIDYVDDFATPAGKPSGAGELIGIVVDDRAWDITPMPETLTTEAFRNPARKSTAYFTTYEYAFQNSPQFNVGYIFAPQ